MRGLTGLALLMAGGLASVYALFPTEDERGAAIESALGTLSRTIGSSADDIATVAPGPVAAALSDRQPRVFSPSTPLFQPTRPAELAAAAGEASRADTRMIAAGAAQPAAAADAPPPAVKAETKAVAVTQPLASPIAGDDAARADLARSLQRELKRVGCYEGEINGTWSTSTRQAMKSFTERVNATLPVSEPDYILLTLVQGHAGEACGRSCPSDQLMAQDGKCQPKAIVAQAGRRATAKRSEQPKAVAESARAPGSRGDTTGPAARERTVTAERGLDGGKSGKAATPAKRIDQPTGWSTTVAAEKAVAQPAPVVAARPDPLPGRMAIGAATVAAAGATAVAPVLPKAPTAATGPAPPAAASAAEAATEGSAAAKPDPDRPAKRATVRPRPSGYSDYSYSQQPKPRRISPPSYAGAYVAPGGGKSARVRRMHYDLFQRPDRTTN